MSVGEPAGAEKTEAAHPAAHQLRALVRAWHRLDTPKAAAAPPQAMHVRHPRRAERHLRLAVRSS